MFAVLPQLWVLRGRNTQEDKTISGQDTLSDLWSPRVYGLFGEIISTQDNYILSMRSFWVDHIYLG